MGLWDRVKALMKGESHLPTYMRDRVHMLSQSSRDVVDRELTSFVDYASVYEVYVWVHKAVSVIADAIAPLPVHVVDADGEPQPNHPVTQVLAYVNDTLAPPDLWGLWVVHMLLGGESFLQIVPDGRGRPGEVWPRRPDLVGVTPDLTRGMYYPAVSGYTFDPSRAGVQQGVLEIPAEEMIHFKFANPLNPYRGLSPARAVQSGITIDLFAHAWKQRFFQKGAHPDYALVAPQGLTPTEREGYADKLRQNHQGYANWFEPIILEQGVTDIKMFSWPPKDVEWLQTQEMDRDEVGGLYGVPDEVMGYGRDTYENFQQAYRWFHLLTIGGLLRRRDSTLTNFYQKRARLLQPGERVITDTSGVGVLQEDKGPKIEQAQRLWAMGAPFNVLDERLGLGIGPVQGGDVGYIPFNLMPAGSEPAPAPPRAESQGAAVRRVVNKAGPTPEYGSPRHKALWKARDRLYTPWVQRMKQQLGADLEKQKTETMAALDEALERAGAKTLPPGYPDIQAGEFFDRDKWNAWFSIAYERYYSDVVRAAGDAELAEFQLDAPFDLGDPRVQQAILEMRIKFADDINATTQDGIIEALRAILQQADEEGDWSVARVKEEIKNRISNVFDLRESDYERERIAHTEMHKASELGHYEGARQAGEAAGLDIYKSWLAALDGRERDSHREAHQTYYQFPIPADQQFEVGRCRGHAPGQTGCPEEDINCRCTALYFAMERQD